MAKRGMNLAAIRGAIASPKTPINLKKGLIKKYGAQLGIKGSSLPYGMAPSKAPRFGKRNNPLAKWETPAMHKRVKRCVKHVSKTKVKSPYGICKASVGGFTKHNPMKRSDIEQVIRADQLSLSKGVYTAYKSFFYTHGKTAEDFAKSIKLNLPTAQIIDAGEVWKTFKGGASIKAQSHWWVKFTLPKENPFLETTAAIAAGITAGEVGRQFVQKRMKKNPRISGMPRMFYIGILIPFKSVKIFSTSAVPNKKSYPMYKKVFGPFESEDAAKDYAKAYTLEKYYIKANPPKKMTKIYDNITAIEATKGKDSLWPGEKFRHDFSKRKGKAAIYGKSDGTLVIKGSKKLWKNFDYPKGSV